VLSTIADASSTPPASVRWLLVGSLALAVLSVVALTLVLDVRYRREDARIVYGVADRVALVSVVLILGVGLSGWGAKGSLIAMVALLLLPVFSSLRVWARVGEFD
jgi:hypothetical protein